MNEGPLPRAEARCYSRNAAMNDVPVCGGLSPLLLRDATGLERFIGAVLSDALHWDGCGLRLSITGL